MDFKKSSMVKVCLLGFVIFIGFMNSKAVIGEEKIKVDAYNISVDLDGQIYDESYLNRYNQ